MFISFFPLFLFHFSGPHEVALCLSSLSRLFYVQHVASMVFLLDFGGPHRIAPCCSTLLSSLCTTQWFHCVALLCISLYAFFHQLHSSITFGALFLFAPLFNSACEFLPFDSSLMICFYISLGIYEFFLALMLLQQHF